MLLNVIDTNATVYFSNIYKGVGYRLENIHCQVAFAAEMTGSSTAFFFLTLLCFTVKKIKCFFALLLLLIFKNVMIIYV